VTEPNRAKWDAGRFFRTLAYYRVIPFIGSWDKFKRQPKKAPTQDKGTILVAGATGGVGKRVVRKLLEQGYQVRSLVRDSKKATEMLGNPVELVEGDITIPQTLTPQVTKNVKAVICCTGTRVQPKEGDTPTREKYYQGIKFYMPEVVDVPEVVEYQGMRNLVQAVVNQAKEPIIFDFTKPTKDIQATWGTLDDVVMGGVSESGIRLGNQGAIFSGTVSTANSGGFASVRTRNFEPILDLSNYSGIDLRVKGDGNRYKFILRNETKWDSICYCYSFDTVANIEFTVRIPFNELIPVFRAKTLKDAPAFDPSHIASFQLMLSKFEYDGELNPKFTPGLFQIQIESIKGYGGTKLPQFIQISSAGVTRPGRPGLNLDEEPPAVRLNDQLGGILTWKLRGEEVIRKSGLPYTIIRPCALTEEPGGKKLMFDQGDNIKGKVSREDIAELCVNCLEQPKAYHVTFEVKESDNGQVPGDWAALLATVKADSDN
jgi:uncharacterized protein YbjT (DUF2867 family)